VSSFFISYKALDVTPENPQNIWTLGLEGFGQWTGHSRNSEVLLEKAILNFLPMVVATMNYGSST
jgi:hypothetical protein